MTTLNLVLLFLVEIESEVTSKIDSLNSNSITTHEFIKIFNDLKRAKNFKEILMYIFGPLGWISDNTTLTVKQMQKQALT